MRRRAGAVGAHAPAVAAAVKVGPAPAGQSAFAGVLAGDECT